MRQFLLDVIMSDHFERLGLPRRFSVDLATIEREYLARSRQSHPDFHQLGTAAEQHASLQSSAGLNEAYLTLKDPYRRAEYLLQLLGGPTVQAEKNLDQAFLMEMMEQRERIEDARAANNTPELSAIETELHARQTAQLNQVAELFAQPATPQTLVTIRRSLNAIKTIESLLRDLNPDDV